MIARFIAAICGHRARSPRAQWGFWPGTRPEDELDGAHVGGVTYRRGPDGRLYGFMDPKPKEKS